MKGAVSRGPSSNQNCNPPHAPCNASCTGQSPGVIPALLARRLLRGRSSGHGRPLHCTAFPACVSAAPTRVVAASPRTTSSGPCPAPPVSCRPGERPPTPDSNSLAVLCLPLTCLLLSLRLRTVGEVRLKLLEEEHSAGAAAAAVAELQRLQVLDDAAYARLFASNKLRTAHWGRFRLRQALLQKHVAPEDADAALDHLFAANDDDDGDGDALLADPDVMSPAERHDALLDAARRQWRLTSRGTVAHETRIRRLAGWLSRRGHDYRTVDVIVRQLVKEDGQDAWQDSDG